VVVVVQLKLVHQVEMVEEGQLVQVVVEQVLEVLEVGVEMAEGV
jgi:hypothetical protein